MRGYLELTRPSNAVAAGVFTAVGAIVAGDVREQQFAIGVAVIVTILATAAGMSINDYFDRDIDAITDPTRPLPRGAVSPRGALAFSVLLFVGTLGLALQLPRLAVAIAAINVFLLCIYTVMCKGVPGVGNVVVAFLTGSAALFGGAAVGSVTPTVVLFLFAGLSTLSREIIKDVEDREGDRQQGLRTLPIVIGDRRALWIAAAALALAILVSPLPYVLLDFGLGYLVLVFLADAVMLRSVIESFDDPGSGHRQLKGGMYVAILAFLLDQVPIAVFVS